MRPAQGWNGLRRRTAMPTSSGESLQEVVPGILPVIVAGYEEADTSPLIVALLTLKDAILGGPRAVGFYVPDGDAWCEGFGFYDYSGVGFAAMQLVSLASFGALIAAPINTTYFHRSPAALTTLFTNDSPPPNEGFVFPNGAHDQFFSIQRPGLSIPPGFVLRFATRNAALTCSLIAHLRES